MFCQNLFSEHAVLFGQNRPLSENSIGAITNCFTESTKLCESLYCYLAILDLYLKTHLFYTKTY